MKLDPTFLVYLFAISNALALPQPILESDNAVAILERDINTSPADTHDLFKRKGGGGRGSSGTSGGGTSSGSSSSSGSVGAGSSSSSAGGRTSSGSGTPATYNSGRSYAGGATVPYTAGGRSPSGLSPVAILPITALAFFPGLWLYSVYAYPYSNPYRFYNSSTQQNETKPVTCLCQQYSVCGCDDNSNATFVDDLIGNGTTDDLDDTVRVAAVNGTSTIFINGTLENGTTAAGAGSKNMQSGLNLAGYWLAAAIVAATVMTV